jgi:hypothetical protein
VKKERKNERRKEIIRRRKSYEKAPFTLGKAEGMKCLLNTQMRRMWAPRLDYTKNLKRF